jgi:stage III sporulation protein AA
MPELVLPEGSVWLSRKVTREDLDFCVNAASRYSPWAAATVSQGYITAAGGHRIGLCGEAVVHNGEVKGLRKVRDLCIRVARDFPGIAGGISGPGQSALILGAPGWGKTTLLRDLIRRRSDAGEHIAVVDERGELFPDDSFLRGRCTDVVSGCTKVQGIDSLLKTMGPDCIAVDEITSQTDCEAIQKAVGCGVSLLATAHGRSLSDLKSRPIYRPLLETPLVECVLVLRKDKSWRLERMEV